MRHWAILRGAVVADPSFEDKQGLTFEVLTPEGVYEVHPTPDLIERRFELFMGGHHLYLMGTVDDDQNVMQIVDAWYDRGQEL